MASSSASGGLRAHSDASQASTAAHPPPPSMLPPPPPSSAGTSSPPGSGLMPLDPSDSMHATTAGSRVIKRRAAVACRRCRRMRSKCVHSGAKPPCEGCRLAGVDLDECVFPARGAPDFDREYRHPRMKGVKTRKESALHSTGEFRGSSGPWDSLTPLPAGLVVAMAKVGLPEDLWELLPPLEQIVEGVNWFTLQYFQLGFIPRKTFVQQLREDPRSINVFLLLALLSVSARLTPSLVAAFGSGGNTGRGDETDNDGCTSDPAVATAELFIERASAVALLELNQQPTLARCQGFYLLSLAQQGSGYRNRSFVNLGIALRMAILMQLHREETYVLGGVINRSSEGDAGASPPSSPAALPALVQKAESARRTLWMLYSQDNLHASPQAPVSLAASDITTLLPSDEVDFDAGVLPATRAALEDTPPASADPQLVSAPTRSLFATLMQSHHLWGMILRRAVQREGSMVVQCDRGGGGGSECYSTYDCPPWDSHSEYARMKKRLADWESHLPPAHVWSLQQLRAFKAERLDLAYVAVTMVTRLCNIVIRKAYMPFMLKAGTSKNQQVGGFWQTMSHELFSNVHELFIQIDVWYEERVPGESTGAQLAMFCVYSCALMATYLCKFPALCPDPTITHRGNLMVERTKAILARSINIWPVARRWLASIQELMDAADPKSISLTPSSHHDGGMAEGRDPIPSALHPSPSYASPAGPSMTPFEDRRHQQQKATHKSQGPDCPLASPTVASLVPGALGSAFPSGSGPSLPPPRLRNTEMLLPHPLVGASQTPPAGPNTVTLALTPAPQSPQLPQLPCAAFNSATSPMQPPHNSLDILVQASFDSRTADIRTATAAARLVSSPSVRTASTTPPRRHHDLQHQQHQQHHRQPYSSLSAGTLGLFAPVGSMSGMGSTPMDVSLGTIEGLEPLSGTANDVATAVATATFYNTTATDMPANDGYLSQLELMLQGSEIQVNTWGGGVFEY